jgi:adenine phosphoribosyltransferase
MQTIEKLIRDIPDFPKPGIIFKDITPLLADAEAMKSTADMLAEPYRGRNVDLVVGIESRGFIFAPLVAERLGAGFVPVRKPGKLPAAVFDQAYELEYGTDTVEIHQDAIQKGLRVVLLDDLLATGGTMEATCKLVERMGAEIVGISFVIELSFLPGRRRLEGYPVHSLVQVQGE